MRVRIEYGPVLQSMVNNLTKEAVITESPKHFSVIMVRIKSIG